ncbi:MAG: DUF4159 domain-containing protein [Pseudobdellovibrionaceae bacterium]
MSLTSLFSLSFANPWFLAAFLILPVLYFLLRVLPPPPKHVRLATAHFLSNLTTPSRTSSKTPWWILLLRLLILALVILAFAGPYRQGSLRSLDETPLLLIIDNSWGASKNWSDIAQKADSVIQSAAAQNIALIVALTTPLPGKTTVEVRGPSEPNTLKAFIDATGPQPVPAEFARLYQKLKDSDFKHSIMISSGIGGAGASGLLGMLADKGPLDIITPSDTRMPLMLQSTENDDAGFSLTKTKSILALSALPLQQSAAKTMLGYNNKGEVIFQLPFTFGANSLSQDVSLNTIEPALLDQLATLRIADETTAGATYLSGKQSGDAHVGIALSGQDKDGRDLTSAATYPAKALEPYADVTTAPLSDLIKNATHYNLLILPDIATAPPGELEALSKWIKSGGTLLRFGGSVMSRNNTLPAPVPLQSGERALGGSISWEGKQKLAAFPPQSPFRDIASDETIAVQKQILAKPLQADDPSIWAVLEDGTPFITARAEGRGMIVMIHTTADPSWSDFALSGLYVKLLKRITELSDAPTESFSKSGQTADRLKAIQVLDGFGQLTQPPPYIEPLQIAENITPSVNSLTPPGRYGSTTHPYSFNLGNVLGRPDAIVSVAPSGTHFLPLSGVTQKDYRQPLLLMAFILFLIDWALITYILRLSEWRRALPHLSNFVRTKNFLIPLLLLFMTGSPLRAETGDTQALSHINRLSLAYIKTGDNATDQKVQLGLETLLEVLKQRTSVEPEEVVALNPQSDALLFYPFIYWAVTPGQARLSDAAVTRLQNYIDHGGLIVLDTGYPSSAGANSMVLQNFLQKMDGLNLPPLHLMPDTHTLNRSFYLLETLQGRESSSDIWVSFDPASPEASVASLIIGGNDWAGGWTGLGVSSPTDQEMALRAGVNITMYALTGNYKSDQLHLPIIMERLGE